MKKIILVNGLIAGAIVSSMFLISYPLLKNGTLDMNSGMLVGYTSMVISLSVIFFGIKTYRDQYLNGHITFGTGFKIGILITLIASIVYASFWLIFSYTVATDFTEFYTKSYLNDLKSTGASEAEIKVAATDMENWNKLYENPAIRFVVTLTEIFPVGLVITLIAAGILRKKQILPA